MPPPFIQSFTDRINLFMMCSELIFVRFVLFVTVLILETCHSTRLFLVLFLKTFFLSNTKSSIYPQITCSSTDSTEVRFEVKITQNNTSLTLRPGLGDAHNPYLYLISFLLVDWYTKRLSSSSAILSSWLTPVLDHQLRHSL